MRNLAIILAASSCLARAGASDGTPRGETGGAASVERGASSAPDLRDNGTTASEFNSAGAARGGHAIAYRRIADRNVFGLGTVYSTPAKTPEAPISETFTLTGIAQTPSGVMALFTRQESGTNTHSILKLNQPSGNLELISVNAALGFVRIRENGVERSIAFPDPQRDDLKATPADVTSDPEWLAAFLDRRSQRGNDEFPR